MSSGAFNVGTLEKLRRNLRKLKKRAKVGGATGMSWWGGPLVGDEGPGHAFHGNQYVDIPVAIKNHPHFDMKKYEKWKAAGKSNQQISNLLSAAKYHAAKAAGTFVPTKGVKKEAANAIEKAQATPVPPEPAEALQEPAAAPEAASAPEPEAKTEKILAANGFNMPGQTAKPPAMLLSKADADKVYDEAITHGLAAAVETYSTGKADAQGAALQWKEWKAAQMAQWAANVKGVEVEPKPQLPYKADVQLIHSLYDGDDQEAALAEWKKDTAAEKLGNFKTKAEKKWALAASEELQAAETKAGLEANAKLKAEQEAAAEKQKAILEAAKAAQKTMFEPQAQTFPNVAPSAIVPDDHVHVSLEDFQNGTFEKEMNALHASLEKESVGNGENKQTVQKALDERLKSSKAFQALDAQHKKNKDGGIYGSLSATLISAWASTSGGNGRTSNSAQILIAEAFGMKDDEVYWSQLKVLNMHSGNKDLVHKDAADELGIKADTPEALETYKAGVRDFVLAQYHNTQADLQKRGIEHVYVMRGMDGGGTTDSSPAERGHFKLQPASSHSADAHTAYKFGAMGKGTSFLVKVPRTQVIGHYLTGYGCTHEHEIVVLNHSNTQAVRMKANKAQHVSSATQYAASTLKPETPESQAVQEKKQLASKVHAAGKVTVPAKPKGAKWGGLKEAKVLAAKGDAEGLKKMASTMHHSYGAPENKKEEGGLHNPHGKAGSASQAYMHALITHAEQVPALKAAAKEAQAAVKAEAKAAKAAKQSVMPTEAPSSTALYEAETTGQLEYAGDKAFQAKTHNDLSHLSEGQLDKYVDHYHSIAKSNATPEEKHAAAMKAATVEKNPHTKGNAKPDTAAQWKEYDGLKPHQQHEYNTWTENHGASHEDAMAAAKAASEPGGKQSAETKKHLAEAATPKPKAVHVHIHHATGDIPKHIAEHPQFTKAKYESWVAKGMSMQKISNNLSALKYHAEKAAGTWKPKKAA